MLCVLPNFPWDSASPAYRLETTRPWEQHKICHTWLLDWKVLSTPFTFFLKCGQKENGKMTASCIKSKSYFGFVCHNLTIESVSLILPLYSPECCSLCVSYCSAVRINHTICANRSKWGPFWKIWGPTSSAYSDGRSWPKSTEGRKLQSRNDHLYGLFYDDVCRYNITLQSWSLVLAHSIRLNLVLESCSNLSRGDITFLWRVLCAGLYFQTHFNVFCVHAVPLIPLWKIHSPWLTSSPLPPVSLSK